MGLFDFGKSQPTSKNLLDVSEETTTTHEQEEVLTKNFADQVQRGQEPDLLTCAVKLAPFVKGLLGNDIGFYVTDLNKNIYCDHGKLKLATKQGDPNAEGGTAALTIKSRQRTVAKVGAEVFGVPYIGACYPLIGSDTNKIVGTMITVTPIERQEKLNKEAGMLEERVNSLSNATTNLSATAEEVAATTENLNNNANGIEEQIKNTDNVIAFIREIAEQTHLLGLNAAIEAARVGEVGAGFNVVAGEIRKLSQDTQNSVKEIVQGLGGMQESIKELTNSIGQLSAATQQQAATAQEINAIVNELGLVAEALRAQADELIN